MVDPEREPLPKAAPEPGTAENIVKKTPWWSISLGLHTVAALVLGWFFVVSSPADCELVLIRRTKPPPPRPDFDPTPVQSPTPVVQTSEVTVPFLTTETDPTLQDDTQQEFKSLQGDNMDHMSDKPFRGPAASDTIDGGGGGGDKGGPFGGRKRLRGTLGSGPNKVAVDAVLAALRWLARHQSADGGWAVQHHVTQCRQGSCTPNPESASGDFDAGVTGLSILAFLGAGYSHLSKDTHDGIRFGDVVRKGLQWMMARQESEGFVGPRTGHKEMYNHAICALALAEAYGLTSSNLFKENSQRAIDCLVAAQNPGKGWRYSPKCGDSDTSVTGWAVMALKSAELSGLTFPRAAYDGARAWLDEATEDSYGRVGYTHRNTGKVYCGHNQEFDHQEALTAISVMCRIFMDKSKADPRISNGVNLIMQRLPAWEGKQTDFYMWYYSALALFQKDGPNGSLFTRWNKSMLDALVKTQNSADRACKSGSWEPVDRWSCEGGRVYSTAINCLTLEIYYRYANIVGSNKK